MFSIMIIFNPDIRKQFFLSIRHGMDEQNFALHCTSYDVESMSSIKHQRLENYLYFFIKNYNFKLMKVNNIIFNTFIIFAPHFPYLILQTQVSRKRFVKCAIIKK